MAQLRAQDDRRARRTRPRRPSGRPAPKVRPPRVGPTRVEVVLVGRELLRGRVPAHSAQRLARHLTQQGSEVRRVVLVDDEEDSIAAALREAFSRDPNLVVTIGGLGPAPDDRTLHAVAEVLGTPLSYSVPARAQVDAAYRRLHERGVIGRTGHTAERERVCRIPVGSTPVDNPIGIAPGVVLRLPGGSALVCLPGEPEEMEAVLGAAEPLLRELGPTRRVAEREIASPTADEAALVPLLERLAREYPHVWIHSHRRRRGSPRLYVRLEATGASDKEADAAADDAVRRLLALAAGSP